VVQTGRRTFIKASARDTIPGNAVVVTASIIHEAVDELGLMVGEKAHAV
jgi:hypothetical protein